MYIESNFLHPNVMVFYRGKAKKRLVKAAMRRARRSARSKGIDVKSVAAYASCGKNKGYWRQYKL